MPRGLSGAPGATIVGADGARAVGPSGTQMRQTLTPDLCVIGAGSAGLSVAAGAAQLGPTVVLIERGPWAATA